MFYFQEVVTALQNFVQVAYLDVVEAPLFEVVLIQEIEVLEGGEVGLSVLILIYCRKWSWSVSSVVVSVRNVAASVCFDSAAGWRIRSSLGMALFVSSVWLGCWSFGSLLPVARLRRDVVKRT